MDTNLVLDIVYVLHATLIILCYNKDGFFSPNSKKCFT